jgi:hypothetical protein
MENGMKEAFLALAIAAMTATPVHADSYNDIAQFAQSICGDIPEGSLTRTSIQGKVGASAGLLAKIISGDASVSGSKTEEIYRGIPFDKLPDKIPTVSMCKSELAKIILAQKQAQNAPGGVIQNGANSSGTVINNK